MLISIPQCIILEFPSTLSKWQRIRFWLSISGNPSVKLHCGNVVNMPYYNMRSLTIGSNITPEINSSPFVPHTLYLGLCKRLKCKTFYFRFSCLFQKRITFRDDPLMSHLNVAAWQDCRLNCTKYFGLVYWIIGENCRCWLVTPGVLLGHPQW